MEPVLLPLAALGAGLVAFTSGCARPLAPAYRCYLPGPASELTAGWAPRLGLGAAGGFAAGFAVVFTALGALSAVMGVVLIRPAPIILQAAGVVIAVSGLATARLIRVRFLEGEWCLAPGHASGRPGNTFPLGMAFAVSWTPCTGLLLASVLAVAAAGGTIGCGAALLALYSLGLGLPFLLLAGRTAGARLAVSWLARRGRAAEIGGGLLLVAVGFLFAAGAGRGLLAAHQAGFACLGWPGS